MPKQSSPESLRILLLEDDFTLSTITEPGDSSRALTFSDLSLAFVQH